jgi:hypothetical protein
MFYMTNYKSMLIGMVLGVGAVVLGLVIANEIIDYMQYQQVLRIKEALIAL